MKHNDYNKNVFINCPFDDKYFNLLQNLIFTVCYFGYQPRISLESSDSGMPRLSKITQLIKESRFSIHDLSRLQAKGANEFYRLNMPFELGIDYGLRIFDKNFEDKKSLVLEAEKYDYMKAISDINGFDIKNHQDNPVKLIICLREWFSETVGLRDLNSSEKIYSDFIDFNKDLFLSKVAKYSRKHDTTSSEKFAKKEIEEETIPELIEDINNWLLAQNQ